MKYQFKIKKFIEDLAKNNEINEQLLISTLRSEFPYKLNNRIYIFSPDETAVIDRELEILVWKEWCIPYKE